MKRFFPSIRLPAILFAALLSCAQMPAIAPAPPKAAPPIREACARAFPGGDWQLVHAITTTMAGRRGMMIGVSVISAQPRAVRCALMSLEGLVMFEARDEDGTITVDRAIPPFDNPDFARGMLDDIRMIFFPPGPQPDDIGLTTSDTPVCRYRTGPEQTVDVEVPSPWGVDPPPLRGPRPRPNGSSRPRNPGHARGRAISPPNAIDGPRGPALHIRSETPGGGTADGRPPTQEEQQAMKFKLIYPQMAQTQRPDRVPPASSRAGGVRRRPARGCNHRLHRREPGIHRFR